jgi:hypothetical protein
MCSSGMTRRLAFTGLLLASLSSVTVHAVGAWSLAPRSALSPFAAASCPATRVHYERNPQLAEVSPWVESRSSSGMVSGALLYYADGLLADARANREDGLVAYTDASLRVRWRTPLSRRLTLDARRVDGAGAIHVTVSSPQPTRTFLTSIRLSSEGCWELALRRANEPLARLRLVVLNRPAQPICEPTPLHYEPNQVVGNSQPWLLAIPTDQSTQSPRPLGASIFTGGRNREGGATKILWVPETPNATGPTLTIIGQRLDAPGFFRQVEHQSTGITPPIVGPVFPSIPRVPTDGCWALTVRTGQIGAIAVFSAIQP